MEIETGYCDGCRMERDHVRAGFMPEIFTRQESTSSWENVLICTECGGLTTSPVTNEQVNKAHKRYIRILVEQGIISENELKEKGLSL